MPANPLIRWLICLTLIQLCFIPVAVQAEDNPEQITLQLKWKHAFQFAGYYTALEKGFYAEAGIDVTINELKGQKSPIEILLAGDADYAVSGANIAIHRAHGDPVLALATIFQHSPYAFLVRADSDIKKVEDFRGQRVMFGSGEQDAVLQATLRRAGIDIGDFIFQPTSFDISSLIRRETDAFGAYVTDQGFTMHEAGIEGRYILPMQYGVDFYGDVLATTEQEAKEHPARLRRFREATLKGWEYALQHSSEIIDLILEKYDTQKFTRQHLEYEAQASRELIQPLLVKIGYMNPDRWDHIENVFVELGFIETNGTIDGLVYNEERNVPNLIHWVIDNKLVLLTSSVIFFISILLLLLFQMRRLVRRRTAELAESEQHWRALIDAEPACVKTLDQNNRLQSMNSSGLKMLGADSLAQILGSDITSMIDAEYRQEFNDLSQQVFNGHSGSLIFCATGLKGRRIWLEIHAVPFRDSKGKITQLLGVTQDLTERKKAERKQEKLQRELTQRQKMVALGQLSGGIAHDFNNILGIVLGYTELAMDCTTAADREKLTDYLTKVERAGHRAKELVDQLLAFSRSDFNQEKSLQLLPLISEEIKMFRSMMPSSIEMVTELADGLPDVIVNSVQLHQVLMNLCINARDAMNGNGTLTISLKATTGIDAECLACHKWVYGDWVELAVSDTGSGIDASIRDFLFDPFFTTKMVGEGTGMGLAMIHGIMSRVGGHILVETELGKGSTFRLMFKPAIAGTTPIANSEPARRQSRPGAQRHVLVVDDEPELAAYLGDVLKLSDYRVTISTNSSQALVLFQENPADFALLVTDQTMPGLTGVELAQKCREFSPDLPVILCTGFSEAINKERAEADGIGYLKKPIDSDQVLQLAWQSIRKSEQKASGGTAD